MRLARHMVRPRQFGLEGNKEPFRHMPVEKSVAALRVILDKKNHPILIHCNEGDERGHGLNRITSSLHHCDPSTALLVHRQASHWRYGRASPAGSGLGAE